MSSLAKELGKRIDDESKRFVLKHNEQPRIVYLGTDEYMTAKASDDPVYRMEPNYASGPDAPERMVGLEVIRVVKRSYLALG